MLKHRPRSPMSRPPPTRYRIEQEIVEVIQTHRADHQVRGMTIHAVQRRNELYQRIALAVRRSHETLRLLLR